MVGNLAVLAVPAHRDDLTGGADDRTRAIMPGGADVLVSRLCAQSHARGVRNVDVLKGW